MRSTKLLLCIVGVLFIFSAFPVNAQYEKNTSQLFVVRHAVVKPSKIGQYETAVKDLMAQFAQSGFDVPYIRASMREDAHYYFIMPVDNFAGVDKINKAAEACKTKIGAEKWQSLMDAFSGTSEFTEVHMARRMNDLSYMPENPRIKPEEVKFLQWNYYYVKQGKEKEAYELSKKYKSLFQNKNIADGYDLYFGDLGTEMPLIVTVQFAKSPSDFYTQSEKINTLLGEEGKKLAAAALKLCRKIEQKNGWARPDLSYWPKKEALTTAK